jgi:hypothetical protein
MSDFDTGDREPLDAQLERDLAALADGSIDPDHRSELERRVKASPRLQALLDEQRRAIALSRRDDRAPQRLRRRIEAERARRGGRRIRLRIGAAAAGLAALALALVLALPGGNGSEPSIADAAALSARGATAPAPPRYDDSRALLDLEVEGVPYPNWEHRFGWRAVGARADSVGNRHAKTVFYARNGRRIGYTIVSGPALPVPSEALRLVRDGTDLQSDRLGNRVVVTWTREGHTCVLAGAGVAPSQLVELGAWKAGGAVPY